jgi:hypothetical protein
MLKAVELEKNDIINWIQNETSSSNEAPIFPEQLQALVMPHADNR